MAQLLGQATAGSQEALFHAVGAVYPALDAGEWWRLLTGAYLHYSPAHFAVNLFFTAFIGMIASPLLGWRAVAAFVAGNAVAAYAQYELGGRVYDNFGGISGGGYALCGVLIVGALLDRLLLPRGLPLLLAGLTAVGILGAEAFSDSAATTAHVAGLVTGAAVAAATVRRVTAS